MEENKLEASHTMISHYYKTMASKQCGIDKKQSHRSTEQNRGRVVTHTDAVNSFMTKVTEYMTTEKGQSFR